MQLQERSPLTLADAWDETPAAPLPAVPPEAPARKRAPTRNHDYSRLSSKTDVELWGQRGAQYYVAWVRGEPGVVIMEGRFQGEQQQQLDRWVAATLRRRSGLAPTRKRKKGDPDDDDAGGAD